MSHLPDQLRNSLLRMGLVKAGSKVSAEPLAGGVSSDIWRINTCPSICLKRALPQLKVAKPWHVDTTRSQSEIDWLRYARSIVGEAVPTVLADDPEAGAFAMNYLDPTRWRVWKSELLNGWVDVSVASAVGQVTGQLHAASANDTQLAQQFATDALFEALRIEPYLLETARQWPEHAARLTELAEQTRERHCALVHGDLSPKNILADGHRIVLLDAECAWYGDPAFDLAFCVTHLMLKQLVLLNNRQRLSAAISAFIHRWSQTAGAVVPSDTLERSAALLPALMLARVDGKSPVDYLELPAAKNCVRRWCGARLSDPLSDIESLAQEWFEYADSHHQRQRSPA